LNFQKLAGEPQNLSLAFGAAAKLVRAEIDLVATGVEPVNRVPELGEFHGAEEFGRAAQSFKNVAFVDYRTQVDDSLVPVKPDDFNDAMKDRLDRFHTNDLAHCSLDGFRPAAVAAQALINPARFFDAQPRTVASFAGGSDPRKTCVGSI
jgi:hypothetical protein